ncbi:MAG: hypothetical protein DRP01_01010 [Archaeoglobales archaeon]|nr:MAG: hypothetical protein DRP01_01010 [Archaeoglobales archaeon]
MVDLYDIDLEKEAEKLAKQAELPKEQVLAEIQRIISEENRPPLVAVIVWKTRNSFQLGAGKVEMIGRVIAKEPMRDTGENKVATIHFACEDPDTHDIIFRPASLWGEDRINQYFDLFELDKCYSFKCSLRNDGRIIRIRDVQEVAEPAPVPKITDIEPTPLDRLVDSGGNNDLTHGWVGRLVTRRDTNEVLGIDIADIESPLPVTVWFGGQYSRMTEEQEQLAMSLQPGDEVLVFGYVNITGSNVSMRAIRIVKL